MNRLGGRVALALQENHLKISWKKGDGFRD